MKLSIIIPAYNEESTIGNVLDLVEGVSLPEGIEKEVLVVNDGSTDSTPRILKQRKGIVLIDNARNRGKGHAIRAGIKHSTGDVMVIQDADVEYDPREIPILLESILEGDDVVYGSRFLGSIRGMSRTHLIGNKIISLSTSVLYGSRVTDTETCYKMMRKGILDGMNLSSDGFDIETELTAKILKRGHPIREIPISYQGRQKDKKKIGYKDGFRAVWSLLKFRLRD